MKLFIIITDHLRKDHPFQCQL